MKLYGSCRIQGSCSCGLCELASLKPNQVGTYYARRIKPPQDYETAVAKFIIKVMTAPQFNPKPDQQEAWLCGCLFFKGKRTFYCDIHPRVVAQ